MKPVMLALALLALCLLPLGGVDAQQPVVYGVFFYSPSCPHCHDVIDYHWPGIQAEFGDQLKVLFIDASTRRGGQIMMDTVQAMNISSRGVPMLIIGQEVMVGSIDIPQRAPQIIRDGLAKGGIPLPDILSLQQLYAELMAQRQQEAETAQAAEAAAPGEPASDAETAAGLALPETASLWDKLAADPVANAIAVVVLVGLVAGGGVVSAAGWQVFSRPRPRLLEQLENRWGWWVLVVTALVGAGLGASLVFGSGESAGATVIAGAAALALLAAAVFMLRTPVGSRPQGWLLPLVALAGLMVAGYLAYVEVTTTEATCGMVGNCNAVQQSPYARILGIPIGVIGVAGYIAILLAWAVGRFGDNKRLTDAALLLMALFGVVFSIYLTFLEPFVIGATCAWCLTSAVVMLLILWLVAPDGWRALRAYFSPADRAEEHRPKRA